MKTQSKRSNLDYVVHRNIPAGNNATITALLTELLTPLYIKCFLEQPALEYPSTRFNWHKIEQQVGKVL
jgi:hypothetical protein